MVWQRALFDIWNHKKLKQAVMFVSISYAIDMGLGLWYYVFNTTRLLWHTNDREYPLHVKRNIKTLSKIRKIFAGATYKLWFSFERDME